MHALGYEHRAVYLNSMVAHPTPQSRDRMYVVFWRAATAPDLDFRPVAWCAEHGDVARPELEEPDAAVRQVPGPVRLPLPDCAAIALPYAWPAAAAIDWSLPAPRIGEGRDGLRATSTGAPMRTQTTRHQDALVVPYYSTAVPQPADVPLPTQTTVDRFGLAFIAELRGGGSTHRPVTQPLATVTASGTHHMLVRQNTARGNPAQMCTPVTEPARTLTTAGHQSLVGWPQLVPDINDCTFRMLQVPEIAAAMAFPTAYQILGTKREQVRQLGNAVTPPASEWLYRRCIDAMNKSSA
jgi:site-specific DNA-cytosine methylase